MQHVRECLQVALHRKAKFPRYVHPQLHTKGLEPSGLQFAEIILLDLEHVGFTAHKLKKLIWKKLIWSEKPFRVSAF